MTEPTQARRQKLSIVYGIMCIVLLLVVMQLWLLSATMNAFLGGNLDIVWPAALTNGACLLLNVGLIRFLVLLDRH